MPLPIIPSTLITNEENNTVNSPSKDSPKAPASPIKIQYNIEISPKSQTRSIVHLSPEKQPRANNPVEMLAHISADSTNQHQAIIVSSSPVV
jgi:hypothetical protein